MMRKNQQYWFKRRRYGWGWVPVTWQGWLAIIIYLVIILLGALAISDIPDDTYTAEAGIYLLVALLATIQLIVLGYKKGPRPKWRWGKRPDDNSEDDW